ncbi:glycosyltransferase family 2 protein [bacterium]|nr:glycosyltransferase family 2 protein [bacterium]
MAKKLPLVTCIIPAYNEEKTIAGVVRTCLETPEIGEVIVVNDGSEDNTLKKLQPWKGKVKIIDLPRNYGKGYAVAQGVKAAQNPLLLFLDADLIDLKPHHLYSLIQPVSNNRADMTVGVLFSSPTFNYIGWMFSGQRCLRKKDLTPLIKEIEKTNYGLEVLLNEKFKNKRIVVVPLIFPHNRYHLRKPAKQRDWMISYVKEVWEVFQKTVSVKRLSYREKIKSSFLHQLASYLRVSYRRVRDYLLEELEE